VTIIVQKCAQTDLGNVESLVVRMILGTIAAGILIGWLIDRRKSARFLTISVDEMACRAPRPGQPKGQGLDGNVLPRRPDANRPKRRPDAQARSWLARRCLSSRHR
jgi:hypothetical protein